MNSNTQFKKQKKKQKKQNEDWVLKLNCKIEFFVPYNGHQNCIKIGWIADVSWSSLCNYYIILFGTTTL